MCMAATQGEPQSAQQLRDRKQASGLVPKGSAALRRATLSLLGLLDILHLLVSRSEHIHRCIRLYDTKLFHH